MLSPATNSASLCVTILLMKHSAALVISSLYTEACEWQTRWVSEIVPVRQVTEREHPIKHFFFFWRTDSLIHMDHFAPDWPPAAPCADPELCLLCCTSRMGYRNTFQEEVPGLLIIFDSETVYCHLLWREIDKVFGKCGMRPHAGSAVSAVHFREGKKQWWMFCWVIFVWAGRSDGRRYWLNNLRGRQKTTEQFMSCHECIFFFHQEENNSDYWRLSCRGILEQGGHI